MVTENRNERTVVIYPWRLEKHRQTIADMRAGYVTPLILLWGFDRLLNEEQAIKSDIRRVFDDQKLWLHAGGADDDGDDGDDGSIARCYRYMLSRYALPIAGHLGDELLCALSRKELRALVVNVTQRDIAVYAKRVTYARRAYDEEAARA